MHNAENAINLVLKIGDGIDLSYNGDLKSFVTSMRHYLKHESVI